MNITRNNLNSKKMYSNNNQAVRKSDSLFASTGSSYPVYNTPLPAFNKYLVNFTGLNRTISKVAYKSAKSLQAEISNFPNSNGVVGNLPSEWISKIPKTNRESVIKELYQGFKLAIQDFRGEATAGETAKSLSNALQRAGVLASDENVTIQQIGRGSFGKGYHLKGISDDKLMIKVFDTDGFGVFGADVHGNYPEINRAAYWQKHAGNNTQMVRFHFGDTKAGYMVNRYISDLTPKPKKYVAPEIYGLRSTDVAGSDKMTGANKINGFQIDYGGIEVLDCDITRDKEAQGLVKKILAAPKDKKSELMKNADIKVKMALASGMGNIPVEEKNLYFKLLAKKANAELKALLAVHLDILPKAASACYFKRFAVKADSGLKKVLITKLCCLTDDEKINYFKRFAVNSDIGVTKELAGKIYYLPEVERVGYFKKFAVNANDDVKNVLASKLFWIPAVEREACRQLVT